MLHSAAFSEFVCGLLLLDGSSSPHGEKLTNWVVYGDESGDEPLLQLVFHCMHVYTYDCVWTLSSTDVYDRTACVHILAKVLKTPNEEESCLFQVTGAHTQNHTHPHAPNHIRSSLCVVLQLCLKWEAISGSVANLVTHTADQMTHT